MRNMNMKAKLMKLSNSVLLSAVWGVAITGLMLAAAVIANADVMSVRFASTPEPGLLSSRPGGELDVIYEPTFQTMNNAETYWHFETSNLGMVGIDPAPRGFLDPFTNEFDVTMDVVAGFILGDGASKQTILDRNGGPNGEFRLWRTWNPGMSEFEAGWERLNDQGAVIEAGSVDINSLAFAVPEPSSAVLVVVGLMVIVMIVQRVS